LTCIRRLILLILNESNLTRRSYKNDCCFVYSSFERFTFHIQIFKQSRFKRFKATTSLHVHKAIEKTLCKWRDEKRSNEFSNTFLVQDDNYELFLNNVMIKNMIKNVHLIKTMKYLRATMIDWTKDWLNKYDKKLMKLVVVVAVIAKKKRKNKHVARKLTTRRNVETIQKNFTFQRNNDVIQENEIEQYLNKIVSLFFDANTFFNNENILFTFIITRIMKNLRTSRRKKKQKFVLKNINSSLLFRNASLFMRVLISQKREFDQITNRSRRDFAIRVELIRKNNLNLLK
jgi:cob(I)alamin adenosyltransferase